MIALHRKTKCYIYILMILLMFIIATHLTGIVRLLWKTGQGTANYRDVLLFSYMRSGSTVTGNLLRDSPGVFYMFEPLSPLARYSYFTNNSICEMRNSTCRSESASVRIEAALTAIFNLYSCNLKSVPTSVIDKMQQEGKSGAAWEEYRACLDQTNSQYDHWKIRCLNRLEQACKNSDYRVAKVLRLGFAPIEHLLKRIPSLKVIYLTRDPRAIINSRIKTSWFPVFIEKPKTVFTNIQSLCLKMKTDIISWKNTRIAYKDRILQTSLTKLASNLAAIPEMYMFMNKEVTQTEKVRNIRYVYKNLMKNITEMWRTELHPSFKRNVEQQCSYVITYVN